MKAGEIVQLIAGTIIIILAAYYCTYWLANRKIRKVAGHGIRVRERFALSKDKLLCTVEVNGRVYLLALTNGGAAVIDSYEAGEFAEAEAESAAQGEYVPNGPMQRAIWGIFNIVRGGVKREPAKGGTDFAQVLRSSGETEEAKADKAGPARGLRTAKEEDSIDEIQRRLKSRKTAGGADSANGEGRRED